MNKNELYANILRSTSAGVFTRKKYPSKKQFFDALNENRFARRENKAVIFSNNIFQNFEFIHVEN